MARLHFLALGAELTVFTQESCLYTVEPIDSFETNNKPNFHERRGFIMDDCVDLCAVGFCEGLRAKAISALRANLSPGRCCSCFTVFTSCSQSDWMSPTQTRTDYIGVKVDPLFRMNTAVIELSRHALEHTCVPFSCSCLVNRWWLNNGLEIAV